MGKTEKIKEFVDCQERLAKKLARELDISNWKICYVEYFPSMILDPKTGEWILPKREERMLSYSKTKAGKKRRIKVRIRLAGNVKPEDIKKINKIMSRSYKRDGNIIMYSVIPFC